MSFASFFKTVSSFAFQVSAKPVAHDKAPDWLCRNSKPETRKHLFLKYLWRKRNNLQELLLAQFAGNRTEDASSYRLTGFIDQHGRILVKANVGSIPAARFLAHPDNHRLHYGALFRRSIRRCFLHRSGDDVAQTRSQTAGSTQRKDHLQLARAGVIGDFQHASHHYRHSLFSSSAKYRPSSPVRSFPRQVRSPRAE